ncbi:MAG: thioredoxin family protein [Candidatus Cloacimonetes bacterium]|nr:thioredoxin family protein [Candidatus Cloacimonadota bacterium]MDD4156092.1 thioredoxin family protein [Candidatus Cloacimonadota bacterium]
MKKILLFGVMLMMGILLYAEDIEKVKPLVTFLEIGAVSCIPCRMMVPVMKEIEEEYGDKIEIIFYDVTKEKDIASKYGVKVIPTQIFLDENGKEFHRHTGFYPTEKIKELLNPMFKP